MGKSLQDQFLKAGLVDKQKAKKVKTEKRRENQQKLKNKTEKVNEVKTQVNRTRALQAKRDRELNKKREETLKEKEISAQVKQLIELNVVTVEAADIPYNFSDGDNIKRIHTSKEIHAQISNGRLGIVKQDDQYRLVPAAIAAKIRQRRPETVIVLLDTLQTDDDDELYADYKIPDDLIW